MITVAVFRIYFCITIKTKGQLVDVRNLQTLQNKPLFNFNTFFTTIKQQQKNQLHIVVS